MNLRHTSKRRIIISFLTAVLLVATLLSCRPIAIPTPTPPPDDPMATVAALATENAHLEAQETMLVTMATHQAGEISAQGTAIAYLSTRVGAQPVGTVTPIPTRTPYSAPLKPTASVSATLTRITGTPTATPDATATAIALEQTIMAIQQPRLYKSYPSPDGKWRAQVVIYDCVKANGLEEVAYEQLKLMQVTSGNEKTADDQLRYCQGLGAFGLAGRFWSPNSRYFYYTDGREGGPDGGCGDWEPPFFRLDTTSLNKADLGAGPLSPDGGKIATWQGRELVVWDINNGELGRVPAIASDATTGPLAWSPDSRALAYVQYTSFCPSSGNKSYIVRIDLPKLEQTLLLESEMPTFGSVKWDISHELRLFDENRKEWRYNLRTQGLNPVP